MDGMYRNDAIVKVKNFVHSDGEIACHAIFALKSLTIRRTVVREAPANSGAVMAVHVAMIRAASLSFCRLGQPNLLLELSEVCFTPFHRSQMFI
jgi:hypothetical protein